MDHIESDGQLIMDAVVVSLPPASSTERQIRHEQPYHRLANVVLMVAAMAAFLLSVGVLHALG